MKAANFVDYKVEIWRRAKFSDNADMDKVLDKIKEHNGVENIFDEDLGFVEDVFLFETEERLEPYENELQSTIEVYKNDKEIYNNGEL